MQAQRLRRYNDQRVAQVEAKIEQRTAAIQEGVTEDLGEWLMSAEADPYLQRVAAGILPDVQEGLQAVVATTIAAVKEQVTHIQDELERQVAPLKERVERWEREGLPVPADLISDEQIGKIGVAAADIFWQRSAVLAGDERTRGLMVESFQPIMDSIEARRMARVKAMQDQISKAMASGDGAGGMNIANLVEAADDAGIPKKVTRVLLPMFAPMVENMNQTVLAAQKGQKALGSGAGGGNGPFR